MITPVRQKNRVLVIGGGIAGTVLALALDKAGFRPVVFEAHEASADGVGVFLSLAPNGIEALRAVDLDATTFGGFPTPRIALRLGTGRLLTEFDNGPSTAASSATAIKRSDLYSALRDAATRRGIEVVYGKRLVDAENVDGIVVARFEDGSEMRGHVLVGADGVHSRVRELIDPAAPRARYVGLLNTGGYARGVRVEGEPGTMQMFFGKRCFFSYVPAPGGEVWWFANPAVKKEPARSELRLVTPEAWRSTLIDLFRDDDSPAAALIDHTPVIQTGWPTYDFPKVPTWHRGRMLVIGDAAHAASPASGQGASMAIEDAVVLSQCLRDLPSVEAAFATYERLRRNRVERVVAAGKKNGNGKTPGLFGRVARDLALRMIFRGGKRPGTLDALNWLYDYRVNWDDRVAA
jgi:FAD-dependent urate hydroxylase